MNDDKIGDGRSRWNIEQNNTVQVKIVSELQARNQRFFLGRGADIIIIKKHKTNTTSVIFPHIPCVPKNKGHFITQYSVNTFKFCLRDIKLD